MPPKGWRKAPVTVADARKTGNGSICSFFSPVTELRDAALPAKKRGRPPKATKTRGKKVSAATPSATTATITPPPPPKPAPKETRVNWSKPENLARLTKALDDWRNKTGPFLNDMPEMSLHSFGRCVGIPKSVLYAYKHPDPKKRRELGAHAGRPALVGGEVQEFVVDVLRRHDRGNEGLSNQEAASLIVDLDPKLKTSQVGARSHVPADIRN